jgi:hypothetical protein
MPDPREDTPGSFTFATETRTMYRTIRPLLLLLLIAFSLTATAQKKDKDAGDLDKKAIQEMYMDFLAKEGYRPEIDADGDVQFKSEGKTYFMSVNDDDPTFFRLVLANIWPIESEVERTQVYIAVDHSNAQTKVAKAFTVKDDVWVGIELFLADPAEFKPLFDRSMSALGSGVDFFVGKMQEQQKTD